jgi:hypothetical protein
MELVLNLAWVLLALPAYWLWRRGRGFSSVQGLLALGCGLVLLFPVISATDDLHAMRAEMEDSSISKRTVRQTGSEKNSSWVNRLQGAPAAVASAGWLAAPEVGPLEISVSYLFPLAGPGVPHAGRAPPSSFLG